MLGLEIAYRFFSVIESSRSVDFGTRGVGNSVMRFVCVYEVEV